MSRLNRDCVRINISLPPVPFSKLLSLTGDLSNELCRSVTKSDVIEAFLALPREVVLPSLRAYLDD